MHVKFGFFGASSFALASALMVPVVAHADTASDNDGSIVVTAQKREQAAQEIPLSLYAISGETVERQGISSVQELGNSAAGVNITGINPGALQLTIRGAGDISSSNQAASVNGYYLDETVISYVPGYMPELSLVDIERVEVLRGPQGTLFGDGSEGGTLRIITRKPDSTETFGRVKVGAYSTKGGDQGYAVQANVNLPLVRDVLAVTVAGGYRDLPGWIDIPDIKVKDSNRSKLADGRIALRYTPNSSLTVDAFYQIGRSKIHDFISTERDELNPRKAAAAHGMVLGAVAGLSPSEGHSDVAALTLTYDAGPATLVSASSLTKATFDSTRDLSTVYPATPFPAFMLPGATAQSIYAVASKAFTQEVRLVSNGDDRLSWTVGAFFKHEKRTVEDGYVFDLPAIAAHDAPLSHSDQKGDAWAVFGDLDYALTDKLSVQAGLRYFEDSKDFSVTQVTGSAFPLGFPPKGTVQAGSDKSNATSPKVGVTYKFSPNVLAFAKYAKGFRAGGANTVPVATYPSATKQFGPDSLNAFEVGFKTTPFDGWTVNLYGYHNDWHDVQLPFCTTEGQYYCTFTYVRNAGDAKTDGVELEVMGDVTQSLNIAVTYAYADSRISGNVTNNAGGIKVGNQIPFNAKHKVTFAAHYETEVASGLQLNLDERYRWSSKTYSDPANTADFVNRPTSQLYLAAGLTGNWGTVTLFADNVFDRADTVAKGPAKVPVFVYSNYLRPRNFGLEFKRAF